MSYPIGDMLVRIKNAQAVKHEQVSVPFSGPKFKIASILQENGFISGVERKKEKAVKAEHEYIEITLKYEDGQGAISGFKVISRPSRHLYVKSSEIKPVRSGYGIAVISTPKGMMSSKEAMKNKIGGEMLFEVW
ncbi:MAG: 30S ribosomal protein S8 [Candidatus Yanofskybacteria bacterium RIFCSPHIGHO2_02_FULL_44_12b]|uniref:Small ribosomal subunit protein uS8 n=2 Tax=Candidatus Yanofskyibacteriota TaxID=1752733 RepID=A0A1F8GIB6_9BACT|nr:MAG: 30S ribosomal protein S8 [Candidatus Yanofskybacteria bacterium GW2011_GWA2_44_9]OGN04815.1 MAG: 30S ribosomal protein S8 [Candidatus Yanofskybacteria bacterium RIFCSPHIGHO2_01_FULL_44_24]OGN16062.1 MAG: 30S ribosomal protein S8 [Candidatus Yanofskybacteria bacterium RIFCSPHIGHO2_02_FULL_44_12b]OGN25132.1 MAG: 30S ribosomal protein S8 [Candidatus Yanofskybacteria bacterium RIFCSPLOWO2_01_FULL_44_22]